jgi:DNA-binding beta-propeller fold protein YncE
MHTTKFSVIISLATLAALAALTTNHRITAQNARCLFTGPTPLNTPVTAAERAAVPMSSTGKLFISVASARKIIIIDLATGQRTTIDAGIDDAHEVAVSPDGRWGVAADFGDNIGNYGFSGRQLAVYDLSTRKLARVVDLGRYRGPHDIEFISPTRLIVTTQSTQHVVEVDVVSGRVLGATETNARGSHTMALTADNGTAFTANEPEGTFSRMDIAHREFLAKHRVAAREVEGIAATPDGREVWLGVSSEESIVAADGNNGTVLARLKGFRVPQRLRMSPDGRKLLVTDFGCETVVVVDAKSRSVIGPIAGLEGAGVAKVLPDNRSAVVLMLEARVVAMVDIETRRVISRFPLNSARPDAAAWGP